MLLCDAVVYVCVLSTLCISLFVQAYFYVIETYLLEHFEQFGKPYAGKLPPLSEFNNNDLY